MENENNSLLELPIEPSEILEEVNLSSSDIDVTDTTVNSVGEMLRDENGGDHISCMESNSIDFEFVHSDLGNSTDFNIDHSSVFGIHVPDNVIDTREDCDDIFRDSACFSERSLCISKQHDIGTSLQSGMVSVPDFGRSDLFKALGLKLQVIPLNNLQYVSTIQTSRGLHILAIPSQTPGSSTHDDINAQEFDVRQNIQNFELDTNPSFESCFDDSVPAKLNEILPRDNTAEKQQTFDILSKLENEPLISVSSSPECPRKVRKIFDRKSVLPRKISVCKSKVQRMLDEKRLMKGKKNKTLYIDVVKKPNLKKRKMVSLLKASLTNKLKESHDSTSFRDTSIQNQKEIKVTFHLKPRMFDNKMANDSQVDTATDIDSQVKVAEHQNGNTMLKSDTEDIIQEKEICKNPLSEDEFSIPEPEKFLNPIAEIEGSTKVSDSAKVSDDNSVKSPEIPKNSTLSSLPKESGKKYQCNICLSTFSREGNFNNHLKTHTEITSAVKTAIHLDKTGGTDENDGNLKHSEQKMRPSEEKESFDTLPSTDAPQNTVTENEVLKCEFCGMEFKTSGNLRRHKFTHNPDTQKQVQGRYSCDVCNKYFLQKCDLKRHVATHSGTYPHVCSVCDKGFIRRSDLTVHEKFHTQEKRYKCHVCSKAYFQTGDLSRHMRHSHGDLCEFACPECGNKYTTQKTLNLHIKSKH